MYTCFDTFNNIHHQHTSIIQRTMTAIPVVRKLSSKKVFSFNKQPCRQSTDKSVTSDSMLTAASASSSSVSTWAYGVPQLCISQQELGRELPQSEELLTPQHLSWNKPIRDKDECLTSVTCRYVSSLRYFILRTLSWSRSQSLFRVVVFPGCSFAFFKPSSRSFFTSSAIYTIRWDFANDIVNR